MYEDKSTSLIPKEKQNKLCFLQVRVFIPPEAPGSAYCCLLSPWLQVGVMAQGIWSTHKPTRQFRQKPLKQKELHWVTQLACQGQEYACTVASLPQIALWVKEETWRARLQWRSAWTAMWHYIVAVKQVADVNKPSQEGAHNINLKGGFFNENWKRV